MSDARRPPRHLQVVTPAAEPGSRNVIVPASGTDARAIIVHFAAQHADTVAKITDQAVDAVAVVIADAGLRGRVDDDDALRAAIHAFVVDRFREFVVARIIETNENPERLEGRSEGEALIYLLSDDRHD